jgi:hypothetical protein
MWPGIVPEPTERERLSLVAVTQHASLYFIILGTHFIVLGMCYCMFAVVCVLLYCVVLLYSVALSSFFCTRVGLLPPGANTIAVNK